MAIYPSESRSLLGMPVELQYYIINNLRDDFDTVMKLSSVCRAFRAIVTNYERQLFPMVSWLRDSKKWNAVLLPEESGAVTCDSVYIPFLHNRTKVISINSKQAPKNLLHYPLYLSSQLFCFYEGIEFRIRKRDWGSSVFISKFSETRAQKLWRIKVDKFVNLHPFKEGFIIVSTAGYMMYKWRKDGELLKSRAEIMAEECPKILSSVYLGNTLFVEGRSYFTKNFSYFHYSVNLHDPTFTLTRIDPKLSNYRKKDYYKKPHSLLKLGTDLYGEYSKKNGKRVLIPLQSKIGQKKNPIFGTPKDTIVLDKLYTAEDTEIHNIANENWTVYYSHSNLCVIRKNQLWMEMAEYSITHESTFLISDFLFICNKRKTKFQVIFLPLKKEVTLLFSSLSHYLINNTNDTLHSFSIQFLDNQIVVSAFIKKCNPRVPEGIDPSGTPAEELVLFKFSMSSRDLPHNDLEEDFGETVITSSEESSVQSEEDESHESKQGNQKSSNAGEEILSTSHSNDEMKTDSHSSVLPSMTVVNQPSKGDVSASVLSDEVAADTENMLEWSDFEKDSVDLDSIGQAIPQNSGKVQQITPGTHSVVACNAYKVVMAVSFIFVLGGLGGSVVL